MIVPDDVQPGEERILMDSDGPLPSEGELFLESCYIYRPDEDDRKNLGKRLDTVYDYVVHWEVNQGTPDHPDGFDEDIMKNFSRLKAIKRFLKGLNENIRARSTSKINLSATPMPGEQPTTVHASQNIYS